MGVMLLRIVISCVLLIFAFSTGYYNDGDDTGVAIDCTTHEYVMGNVTIRGENYSMIYTCYGKVLKTPT